MACNNIKIISTTLSGNVSKVSANTLAANKLQGIKTPTADVVIDNTKHTVAVNVNTDTMLTKEAAMTELDRVKQEISTETDDKIESLEIIGYEVITENNN